MSGWGVAPSGGSNPTSPQATAVTTSPHSGTYCCQVQPNATYPGIELAQQFPALPGQSTWGVSYWAKNDAGSSDPCTFGAFGVYINSSSQIISIDYHWLGKPSANVWTQYSCTFATTPAGTVAIEIILALDAYTSGTYWFDDAVLTGPAVISVPPAAVLITGKRPSLKMSLAVPKGALTVTGKTPTLLSGKVISVPPAALHITGKAPGLISTLRVSPATGNLLGDPWGDFSSPSWNTPYPGYTMTPVTGPTGDAAMQFAYNSSCNVGQGIMNPVGKYTASVWLKGSGNMTWGLFSQNGATITVINEIPITLTGSWTQYTVSLTALPGDTQLTWIFYPNAPYTAVIQAALPVLTRGLNVVGQTPALSLGLHPAKQSLHITGQVPIILNTPPVRFWPRAKW